jgi:hypothetical protein
MNIRYGVKTHAFLILCAVPAALLNGYALATLWQWFVVPLGLPAIGFAHAYGLGQIASLATLNVPPVKDRDVADAAGVESDATKSERSAYVSLQLLYQFLPSLLALLFGYVAHVAMVAK